MRWQTEPDAGLDKGSLLAKFDTSKVLIVDLFDATTEIVNGEFTATVGQNLRKSRNLFHCFIDTLLCSLYKMVILRPISRVKEK